MGGRGKERGDGAGKGRCKRFASRDEFGIFLYDTERSWEQTEWLKASNFGLTLTMQ